MITATEPTIPDMLDTLNGYEGDDIWNDLIYRWTRLIDWPETHRVDRANRSDRFVTKSGVHFHYREDVGSWRAI